MTVHRLPNPAVLLRHDTPDGSWHADLLFARTPDPMRDDPARGGPDARTLMAWRLDTPPAWLLDRSAAIEPAEAIRLPDHRVRYLTHEGDTASGNGTVRRLAAATCLIEFDDPLRVRLRLVAAERTLLIDASRLGDAPDEADAGPPPLGLWRLTPTLV